MLLPNIMNEVLEMSQVDGILQTNQESQKYGLILTLGSIKEMISVRNEALKNYGRVELSIAVIKKMIQSFCSSSFIVQENYESTINELLEIFYYMKNETGDGIGDDELISIIKDFYNNHCGGSIEFLQRELEVFARKFRSNGLDKGCFTKRGDL